MKSSMILISQLPSISMEMSLMSRILILYLLSQLLSISVVISLMINRILKTVKLFSILRTLFFQRDSETPTTKLLFTDMLIALQNGLRLDLTTNSNTQLRI